MNEPVAWKVAEMVFDIEESAIEMAKVYGDEIIPLYTHQYERPHNTVLVPCDKLSEMQAEIEALKAEIVSIEKNTDYWADKANWIKNNEPVAKVTEHGIYLEYPFGLNLKIGTLLYTHPVKEQDESFDRTASHMAGEYVSYQKELTDEEITEVYKKVILHDRNSWHEFARAILRKAQEK
jgi:hypothetical protein